MIVYSPNDLLKYERQILDDKIRELLAEKNVRHPNSYKNIKSAIKNDVPLNKKNRKSTKKRKNTIDKTNIDAYIKEYIKNHPEVIAEYVKTYIDANLRVDFVSHTVKSDYYNSNNRFTVGLYDGNRLISESKLGLNI